MRALHVVRPDPGERPGGDVAVVERGAAALRAAGVEVDVVATETPDPRGYDVAHVFGVFEPETQGPQIAALAESGVPLVVSPIWWDRSGLFALGPRLVRALDGRDPHRVARQLARLRADEEALTLRAGRGAQRRLAEQAALLARCDLALPASEIEAYACARTLRVLDVPYVVARYGVEPASFEVPRAAARSGVVCIGRIERLKNQAMLLYALRDLDLDVTLIGASYDPDYLAVCRRWASPRTRFVDRLPLDDLRALLGRTAVHVLPSWGDLPGLVSLEAAAAGARIVVGNRGSEREYVGPDAGYADPLDPDSIRAAVLAALDDGPRAADDALDARVRGLTWERYAADTRAAYQRVVR
ncbi:MAG: glycosyltransferase family 4 protein [Vulcanimicrobiaceae bacterium]|jgi:glycosyltransferase involved in cell wall biosynthesis